MKYLCDTNKWGVNEAPSWIERLLVMLFRVRVIFKPAGLYLRRFYLTPRWKWLPWKVFLHHGKLSDYARFCHDHPWPFKSIMLKGRYVEWIQANSFKNTDNRIAIMIRRDVHAGDIVTNGLNHIHRLEVPGDFWTLVIVGKAQKMWGFHTTDHGWVPWREYLNLPNAPDYPEDML